MRAAIRYASHLPVAILLVACRGDTPPTSPPVRAAIVSALHAQEALGAVHRVTGFALSPDDGAGEVAWSISAHVDAAGDVRGQVTVRPDLTTFGLGTPTVIGRVTCLVVDGNTAWFDFVATNVVRGNWPSPGDRAMGWIQDNGPGSVDVAFSVPAAFAPDPSATCDERPAFPASGLVRGNFVVREALGPNVATLSSPPTRIVADKVAHSVTGRGLFHAQLPGGSLAFSIQLGAHRNEAGDAWGRIVSTMTDLSAHGITLEHPITVTMDVTCLEVVGNRAWIRATVSHSMLGAIPPGASFFTWIEDQGDTDAGLSVMLEGAFLPITCADRPEPPAWLPATAGNFSVR